MDRTVLLVLLGLQAFLLITAFFSTDAAALVRYGQLSRYQKQKAVNSKSWIGCWGRPGACGPIRRKQKAVNSRSWIGCWGRPGACGPIRRVTKKHVRRQKRSFSGCFRRPGACGPIVSQ